MDIRGNPFRDPQLAKLAETGDWGKIAAYIRTGMVWLDHVSESWLVVCLVSMCQEMALDTVLVFFFHMYLCDLHRHCK